jgi:hypothetical protein
MKHRIVALLGLTGMVPICLGLVRATLTVETAAQRALVLLVICAVLDKVVLPVGLAFFGPPKRRDDDREPVPVSPAPAD